MRRTLQTVALASLLATVVAAAQNAATTCSFDTAAHTVMQTVTLALAPAWRTDQPTAMRDDYLLAAQTIQSHFQPPQQLRMPFWARTVSGDTAPNGMVITAVVVGDPRPPVQRVPNRLPSIAFQGSVRFRLSSSGRLVDSSILVDTPSPDLADALVSAIKGADSAQAFSPPSDDVRKDQGTTRLRLIEPRQSPERTVSLLRLAIPTVVVDTAPEIVFFPRTLYPEQLRQAGISDRILVRVLVLPTGTIDTSSIDLLRGTYREFVRSAIIGIEGARFRPARVGGCAVPAISIIPVVFRTGQGLLDTISNSNAGQLFTESDVAEHVKLISGPAPRYPDALRKARVEGRVLVQAVIDTLGQAEPNSVKVILSPNPGFDQPAIDYVLNAQFTPGRMQGRPVRVLVNIPIDFKANR